ncbi:hypothetical protein CONCODRAFT_73375 [Conidiobolus coronatus NRRL 28638]|uniref:Uncharacterized protein n=1 Tax=Conidiobolus coronatus (strain ATCC 28846 / CBS 209.66 / NRRL 28638) TaxID=796925 RepID=A0A137NVS9_CONC2|nr:hypothetical protein CONCODRAFT_73375 [Conidiobolus coronatus NRRL 28638]|eukprot:KXN66876.1 hypothetical protein CONCODRAFT_73375 [Conidiobolus coronatus NRRL 28638]
MSKSIPINIPTKSKYSQSLAYSLSQSPKELGKSLIQHLSKFKCSGSLPPATGQFILEPIDEHMSTYRKGFESRSLDSDIEFDQIINEGWGTRGDSNKKDLTLKLSLTPNGIRNPGF